jgi:eukaryotic-like serine/threonine-protein kinase
MSSIQPNFEPLPGYRLISRLGRGGCGEVWKAEAPGGMHKAVKFVYGDMDGITTQGNAAEQEYKSLNRVKAIRHPFILSIERFDVVDGQLVIVMELADKNLQDRYNECASVGMAGIPREELLRYMEESAEALDLMNTQHQIQHMDIKPQNIFLIHQHVKVADFGLAKDMEGARAALTGGMTPLYAAPETFDGWVSRQSDQYSLAIVYQEMLTGKRPFTGTNNRQLVVQHTSSPPDVSTLPASDQPAILRALSKSPDDRFASCMDFVRVLRAPPAEPVPLVVTAAATTVEAEPKTDRLRRAVQLPSPPRSSRTVESHTPTARRPAAAPTGSFARPSDRGGEGVLVPVMLVGVGSAGRAILQSIRRLLLDRFGRPTLPHFRWLYLDTDPSAIRAAERDPPEAAFNPDEVLLLPPGGLGAESFTSDTRPTMDTLNRRPVPALAGGDVGARVRSALTAFTRPEVLTEADRFTRLGVRSSQPRIYLAGSLADRSTAAMIPELAGVIRMELAGLSLSVGHVMALLGAPTGKAQEATSLAATVLAEIQRVRPFRRCYLFPLRARGEFDPAVAANTVVLNAVTTIGRTAYPDRASALPHPFVTVGVRRVVWPRDRMVQAIARNLAHATLSAWAGALPSGAAQVVAKEVEQQWRERRMELSLVRTAVEYGAAQKLRAPVESLFQELLPESGGKDGIDLIAAGTAMKHFTDLLGTPMADEVATGRLGEALDGRANELTAGVDAQLTTFVVSLIERPGLRVAAAREAIRAILGRLNAEAATAERELAEVSTDAQAAYTAMTNLLANSPVTGKSMSRRLTIPAEFSSRLSEWATLRFQQLRDRAVVGAYRRLLTALPEFDREVEQVTAHLSTLAKEVGGMAAAEPTADGVSDYLYPDGARTAEEAADRLAESFGTAARREFDERLQAKIRSGGKGLVHLCADPVGWGRKLVAVTLTEAERFVAENASRMSASQALMQHFPRKGDLLGFLQHVVEEATPASLTDGPNTPATVAILGLPDDPAGQQVGDLLRGLAVHSTVLSATVPDEIVVYQECRNIDLATLPHLLSPAINAALPEVVPAASASL